MRPGRAVIRAAARRDLARYADCLQAEAGLETSRDFLQAAQATFVALGDTPGMGSMVPTRLAALATARKWRVTGFTDQLIFYETPTAGGVEILRVLHAQSNWRA